MKQVIKLTRKGMNGEPVLIGVESIISVKRSKYTDSSIGVEGGFRTVIESRGAMIATNYVEESVEEIYELINL